MFLKVPVIIIIRFGENDVLVTIYINFGGGLGELHGSPYIFGLLFISPPGGGEWIISIGNYVNNSFTALGSSDPREVRLEL